MRIYAVISGVIFAFVSAGHLLRLFNEWPIAVGPYSVPLWLSWIGMAAAAALAVWAAIALAGMKTNA